MAKLSVKELGKILIVSFNELKRNEPLRLAGATAFFTTFALPPILIILVQIIGIVFRIENLRDKFFGQLAEIVGRQGAAQVKITFSGFTALAGNWMITAGGFVFLMFVATTLFKVIKDSLNQLWNVRIATKKPFKANAEKRAVSMIVILLTGILLVVGMVAEGLGSLFRQYLASELPKQTATFLNILIKQTISIIIVAVWFAVLFKVLPDAKASWKVVIAGGFFTGILFTAGKIIIRYMLSFGNLTTIFGASSSLVLLLLFVFYSSFILYYGACFTKVFATYIKDPIKAGIIQ
ncbi:MAG: YihY/virulence factor BrkB family protein [Segetibacter sp.]